MPQQTVMGGSVGPFSWGPRYWLVPTNASHLDIGTVEVTSPSVPSPAWAINWSQLAQNGAQPGQAPVWSGYVVAARNGNRASRMGIDSRPAGRSGRPEGRHHSRRRSGGRGECSHRGRHPGQRRCARHAGRRPVHAMEWRELPMGSRDVRGSGNGHRDDRRNQHRLHACQCTLSTRWFGFVSQGVVQKNGLDYTISGNTVTFVTAATPQPADVLLAWYRY